MTASTDAAPSIAAQGVINRYYLAMAVPFAIDVVTLIVYALMHEEFYLLPANVAMSAAFLLLGVGIGAYFLVRPIGRFIAGEVSFADIEDALTGLPRRSALVMALCYVPMLAVRMLSRQVGIDVDAMQEDPSWLDLVASFVVGTGFNVLLIFFVVSAYLDQLCERLFLTRNVNIHVFHGRFRRKVSVALLFMAFAGVILLSADIASYSGPRLLREATMDVVATIVGTLFMIFWVNHALSRPLDRLDHGMRQVAKGDYQVRLPVTSDDEMGHAAGRFNEMVEGLSEREYLRDTFGKYVSTSVAAAILDNRDRAGRVADTTAEATLMFTDIEGFTGLSERLAPAKVAAVLNAYLGAVVPVIQRHGGVVNSFIGDGLFATFNLPLPCQNHAAAAIAAAIEIQRTIDAGPLAGHAALRTRIGLNTGTVIGVTIGTDNRLNYTVLGDAVNVASRVEQLNKRFGSRILATESTVRAAGSADCEKLGTVDVRGHEDVVVYRVGPAT
ncbi:MAG: HAMP domain-containing protein [Rhodospirillales bacterium]|nr:HAMP domain-containing protein [Rhodospirillales bacterium]